MTAAYICTPVGAQGLDEGRSQVVQGPSLRDTLTRQELARRLVAQAQELQVLKRQLPVAQAAARHMEALRQRMNNESALRTRYQQQLHQVALGFAIISGAHPEARKTVEAVRDEIFGIIEEEETGV